MGDDECLNNIRVLFGPEAPSFGSWVWLGKDLVHSLTSCFSTGVFRQSIPDAEVVVFIKFLPEPSVLKELNERSVVVYCPVDIYGSAAEIDSDAEKLVCCDRIVVHCHRLVRYFASYAPTTYMDHHVKYVVPTRSGVVESGPILWVGERSNLDPLVQWINESVPLPETLLVLTNVEDPADVADPSTFGFRDDRDVVIQAWSPEAQMQCLHRCRAAFDIKGNEFRPLHKPPAKAIDFLASGVPLAMNSDSSSVEHLRHCGFNIPTPDDTSRWLSREYAVDTQRFGQAISELFSLQRVTTRWEWMLRELITTSGTGAAK